MKKLTRLLFTLSLSAAAVLSAQDQTPPQGPHHGGPGGPGGPGRHGRGPGGSPFVRALDTDHDGVISAAELANAPAALRALDANGDGSVTLDELRPARPADAPTPPPGAPPRDGRGRPHPVDPIMLALDADHDGVLSSGEIARATASLSALDANHDGKLTPDEYRPLPPAQEQ
jgi:hypothetical protein